MIPIVWCSFFRELNIVCVYSLPYLKKSVCVCFSLTVINLLVSMIQRMCVSLTVINLFGEHDSAKLSLGCQAWLWHMCDHVLSVTAISPDWAVTVGKVGVHVKHSLPVFMILQTTRQLQRALTGKCYFPKLCTHVIQNVTHFGLCSLSLFFYIFFPVFIYLFFFFWLFFFVYYKIHIKR